MIEVRRRRGSNKLYKCIIVESSGDPFELTFLFLNDFHMVRGLVSKKKTLFL